MQYDEIRVREQRRDGERIVEIDGYNRPRPDSKYTEYRRIAIVDLTEDQVRTLHTRLGDILDQWE